MLIPILFIIGAIALLYFGAELALGASEVIGKKLKLSPLVIGMVLVGLGTSLPELFVAQIASIQGKSSMATGALVGSNLANMLLILGIAGLFTRLRLKAKELKAQLLVHLLLSVVVSLLLFRGKIDYVSSASLIFVFIIYIKLIFNDIKNYQVEDHLEKSSNFITSAKLIVGFTLLYFGGEFLVRGGVDLCNTLGVSEYIVSSIFVAFGTSFPELVTVLMSVIKKKDSDLIIGNIIGSNLFNCSLILATLGGYKFALVGDFSFEVFALVAGSLYLVLCSFLKRDFFRFSSLVFLILYTIIILAWSGFITRSSLWI